MRWNRRQFLTVLIIPTVAVVWIVYRLITRTPDLPPDTENTTASAPAAMPSPSATLQRREPDEPVTSLEVKTDDEGRFQLRHLATGAYRVTFGDPGDGAFTAIDGVAVNAIYGANLLDLRLQTSSAGALGSDEYQPNKLPGVIRGNVVDATGAPIAGVRVRARRQ